MRKICVILSLLLLSVGAAGLRWGLNERKKEQRLQQEYRDVLKASQTKLDKLVAGQTDAPTSTDVVVSENLKQQLDKYKEREETVELVLATSSVCALTGGLFLGTWSLLGIARLLNRFFSRLKIYFAGILRKQKKSKNEKLTKTDTKGIQEALEEQRNQPEQINGAPNPQYPEGDFAKHSFPQLKKQSKVLVNSGWHNFDKDYSNRQQQGQGRTNTSPQKKPCSSNHDRKFDKTHLGASSVKKTGKAALLISDEECISSEDSFKVQAENIEKQMAELSAVAKNIQQMSLENSEPLNNTLTELTEHISAIRDYAGQQQERVEKLQQGYDWNIIRTFCLRIIRCIDNTENRIEQLTEKNIDTTDLKEVRDEMVFALESSGVERFEPKINSDYHGQEKMIEIITDKEQTTNPKLKGKIAKVIRPGYRCIIDDENVKVVRTAQVKLFE